MGNKYKHYKGNMYETITLAQHTETLDPLVIYKDESGKVCTRPTSMFFEDVKVDGKLIPRFELVEEDDEHGDD